MRAMFIAALFVAFLNVIMFFGQNAVEDINPGAGTYFNYEGSDLQSYDQGNYTLPTDPTQFFPNSTASVSPTTGNIFTDAWSATINWFESLPGIKQVRALWNTPPNFLRAIGLPTEAAFALGYMWSTFSALIMVGFIKGMVM